MRSEPGLKAALQVTLAFRSVFGCRGCSFVVAIMAAAVVEKECWIPVPYVTLSAQREADAHRLKHTAWPITGELDLLVSCAAAAAAVPPLPLFRLLTMPAMTGRALLPF